MKATKPKGKSKNQGGIPDGFKLMHELHHGNKDIILRLSWTPDGTALVSTSVDKSICLWELSSGDLRFSLTGHYEGVNEVACDPDQNWLASCSFDQTIRIWDLQTRQTFRELRGHSGDVSSVNLSPDGKALASASADQTIRLWNTDTWESFKTLAEHTSNVYRVAWSPDGELLASCSKDGKVIVWNVHTWQKTHTIDFDFRGRPASVTWSRGDGRMLAVTTFGRRTHIWNRNENIPDIVLEGHTNLVRSATFSHDNRVLATSSSDGTVRLWSVDTWKELVRLPEPASGYWPQGIAFHPTEPILATFGDEDKGIRIWRVDYDMLLSGESPIESVQYTTAKIVLVGDSGVGKTGLGWRLAHGEFKDHTSTHGQQFWVIPELRLKRKDGTECEAVLWDLAGQPVYRQIHSIFLENVAAALVLFDPSNRQDPLKGVQFWLEQLKGKNQLPPTVLVGARVDRGAPTLSQQELDQFCQQHGIRGGYLSTSASSGEGLDALLVTLKTQIPWDKMTATVTTVTFKRIKDYVLSLKERTDRKGVLVSPVELRTLLEAAAISAPSEVLTFTDAEMMTAVGHLETHGYVCILQKSDGETYILLTPDLLANLAASIVLLADKNPRELGAVSETELLHGGFLSDELKKTAQEEQRPYYVRAFVDSFDELKGLAESEQQTLLEAAILRFLTHNICFRETFDEDTLLIFPSLIKQKRPLQDDFPASDDLSYVVRGRVENLYASLVVLLGYTPSFTRINQWQNQAQYEMGVGEICGFRLIEDREGEIELVLYYSDQLSADGRRKFQELFELFLYQHDVDVTRFPPAICPKGHLLERKTFIQRLREGQTFVFCYECDDKVSLPTFLPTIGIQVSPWLQREEAAVRLRSDYEVALTRVKSYRRGWESPCCYVSHVPAQALWAAKLKHDLRDAGVFVVEQAQEVQPNDFVIVLDTLAYQQAFNSSALAADAQLIHERLSKKRSLVSLKLDGTTKFHELKDCTPGSFCDETHYPVSLFDLVLNLYAIPLTHAGFAPERHKLHEQWEQTARRLEVETIAPVLSSIETYTMSYQDFQVLVTSDRKIRASSEQGDEWGELRLEVNKIKLALNLIEKGTTDGDLLKSFGGELYQALFPNKVHGHWRATKAGAEASGSSVRLRLIFELPELAALPWEFLYDESTNTFIANDTQTALSRYLDVPQSKRGLGSASRPLKILLVISSPKNLSQLDTAGEEALIREALAKHINAGDIELDVVHEATIRNLTQQLRTKPYNVFHFIGHGDFANDKGIIALVETDGQARLLNEEAFANLFLGNRSIGLAMLNSCNGAASSSYRAMTGVAPNLVRRGLPAVIAMQYSIRDTTAKQFADEFYRTLALGWPVDAALQTTRNAISIEVGTDQRDFATPVLYMRSKDGVIFSGT
jgi:small GTP-binding protein